VYSLSEQNRFYKQAAAFCLRAVAKHSPELAQAVIDSGALDSLVTCLEEFDPGVKEAAAWTLGYIAGHNAELSQQASARVCKRACARAFAERACAPAFDRPGFYARTRRHGPSQGTGKAEPWLPWLCAQVVDAGAVPLLVLCVQEPELSLKRIAASSLSDIAKHTPELAQVGAQGVLPGCVGGRRVCGKGFRVRLSSPATLHPATHAPC